MNSHRARPFGLVVLLMIVAAIPLTVVMSQRQQDVRQHASCVQKFNDVICDNPYEIPISSLTNCNLITAIAKDTFLPYSSITRGDFVAAVARYHISIKGDWQMQNVQNPSFSDVDRFNPNFAEIETAKKYGFIDNSADGNFRPFAFWNFGFRGINRSDYDFKNPENEMARAYFAQQMYNFGIKNDKEKLNSCAGLSQENTAIPTP